MARSPINRAARNARALATSHLLEDLGKRSAQGGAIAIAAQGVRIALQLGNAAILARLLPPEDFGLVAMAMVVTGFVGLFTDLGLSVATVQRRDIDQNTASALFFINVVLGVIAMIVCFAIAPAAAWFFSDERVRWVVLGMATIVPIGAATAQHGALLARGMRWMTIQWIGILAQLVGMITGVLVATFTDLGYWALVANTWVCALAGLALSWIVCPWRPSVVRDWNGARGAINFGLYLTGFNFAHFMGRQLDVVLIGWLWGPTETGYYTRAYSLMLLPLNAISGPLGSAFVPALSRLQSDPERWRAAFMKAFLLTSIMGCAFASILIVVADNVILVVYGPKWHETIQVFKWLSCSMIATFPMGAMAWAFISLGRTKAFFHWGVIAVVSLACAFAMAVPQGAVGVAKAYSIAVCILTPICFHFALHGSPVPTRAAMAEITPLWLSAGVAVAVGLTLKHGIELSLIAGFVIEGGATAFAFAASTTLLTYRRPEYRRVFLNVLAIGRAVLTRPSGARN